MNREIDIKWIIKGISLEIKTKLEFLWIVVIQFDFHFWSASFLLQFGLFCVAFLEAPYSLAFVILSCLKETIRIITIIIIKHFINIIIAIVTRIHGLTQRNHKKKTSKSKWKPYHFIYFHETVVQHKVQATTRILFRISNIFGLLKATAVHHS